MLEARNISKSFGGVTALANISLTLLPGKVTAIIGENGAGKSTLMKIFSGVHTQYGGDILLDGKVVRFSGTAAAEAAGIAIIHQELNLVPHLTIAENIFLGRELTLGWGVLDKKRMHIETEKLLSRLQLEISPQKKITDLRVGQQQLVEIAKALHTNAAVIIMDEPTSAISDKEVEHLFRIIGELKAEGKTIAYISHKFNELFAIADRYVVLRDGTSVDAGDMKDATRDTLIRSMTGREIRQQQQTNRFEQAGVLLTVKNISLRNPEQPSKYRFRDISFQLHKGEVLGIYGLMGAGRTEIMETLFGLHPQGTSGDILVENKKQKIHSPGDAIKAGIALVPEDRKRQGLILNQSVQKNISITVLRQVENAGILLSKGKEDLLTDYYIRRLGIRTASGQVAAQNLSGGNQQKIVIAKWLATKPKILLLDEPTRGIDINAKAEIYNLMKILAAEGMGIIMVSSELPEILAAADRVLVISEGRLTADLPADKASEQEILNHALHIN